MRAQLQTPRAIVRVAALIDWNNVDHALTAFLPLKAVPRQEQIFKKIQEAIASCLNTIDATRKYRVNLRLYDGWHSDRRPTQLNDAVNRVDRSRIDRTIGRVSFSPDFTLGNDLACGSAWCPLYNTSRSQGQKMVDTALSIDTLYILYNNQADIALVVSDDDDLVPGVLAAQAAGRHAYIMRSTERDFRSISDGPPSELIERWVPR